MVLKFSDKKESIWAMVTTCQKIRNPLLSALLSLDLTIGLSIYVCLGCCLHVEASVTWCLYPCFCLPVFMSGHSLTVTIVACFIGWHLTLKDSQSTCLKLRIILILPIPYLFYVQVYIYHLENSYVVLCSLSEATAGFDYLQLTCMYTNIFLTIG